MVTTAAKKRLLGMDRVADLPYILDEFEDEHRLLAKE